MPGSPQPQPVARSPRAPVPYRSSARQPHLARAAVHRRGGRLRGYGQSGYGFKLWRILATCGAALLLFTALHWGLGIHSTPGDVHGLRAVRDSFLVSLAGMHGRAPFEQLGVWTPPAWTAAGEALVVIVIEGVFSAMLLKRFFTR